MNPQPDLDAFRKHGGKLNPVATVSATGIMPEGTVDYYEKVTKRSGGDLKEGPSSSPPLRARASPQRRARGRNRRACFDAS